MPQKKGPGDPESGMYAKVGVADDADVAPTKAKGRKISLFGKPPRESLKTEAAQEKRKVRESKQDALAEENAAKYQNADSALDTVVKANLSIKLLACLQNPKNIMEIINAKTITEEMEQHYGTTDPIEVAKLIFADIKEALRNGTWSIGRLAFFGGAYAFMEGFFMLLPPMGFLKMATPLACINVVFLTFFGAIIMTVESSGDTISMSLKTNIMKYCAALDTIWGRGIFYCYVGTTQILGGFMTAFGYYMFCIGVTMLVIYHMTSKHLSELSHVFTDNRAMEAAFKKYAGVDGVLDRHELAKLLADVGIEMGHAELEMMLKRLDPDHDGYIGLDELKKVLAHTQESEEAYYTIGPVPKLKPGSDTLKIETSGKKKGLFSGNSKDAAGNEIMDWSNIKQGR